MEKYTERYTAHPNGRSCPDGYDYVKGYTTTDGKSVKPYCRESERKYIERLKTEKWMIFDEEKKLSEEYTNKFGKEWGTYFKFDLMPVIENGKIDFKIVDVGIGYPTSAGMYNLKNGEIIKKDEKGTVKWDSEVSVSFNRDEKRFEPEWSGSRSLEESKLKDKGKYMIKNLEIANQRCETLNSSLKKYLD